jgi:hypothetical protein
MELSVRAVLERTSGGDVPWWRLGVWGKESYGEEMRTGGGRVDRDLDWTVRRITELGGGVDAGS